MNIHNNISCLLACTGGFEIQRKDFIASSRQHDFQEPLRRKR